MKAYIRLGTEIVHACVFIAKPTPARNPFLFHTRTAVCRGYHSDLVDDVFLAGKAEMSCVNFPGALMHLATPIELGGDRGHLYNIEEIRYIRHRAGN